MVGLTYNKMGWVMSEREANVLAVMNVLDCLNDAPFKIDGMYANRRHMAEAIVDAITQEELNREYAV